MISTKYFCLFLVWSWVPSQAYDTTITENHFNCQEECGYYAQDDKAAPLMQSGCKAMTKSEKCQPKFNVKQKKKRKKKNKKKGERIVGGYSTKKPMPWMVFIEIDLDMCGGSLINSQFVLTAAHCFCNTQLECSRNIGEIGKDPIIVKEKKETLSRVVKLSLGLTYDGGENVSPKGHSKIKKDGKLQYKDTNYLLFSAEKIFINPKLGTSTKFVNTPDQALVKMDARVTSFHSHIRPICLSTATTDEKPFCPDNSQDRAATKKEKETKQDGGTEKMQGGCATVAGWGYRYSHEYAYSYDTGQKRCRTNFEGQSQHKIGYCLDSWKVNGKEHTDCTKENIPVEDLAKPCRLLTQELEYQHQVGKILNKQNMTPSVDEIVKKSKSPVQLIIKIGKTRKNATMGKKSKGGMRRLKRYCGRTKFGQTENEAGGGGVNENGWCATKVTNKTKGKEKKEKGKIEKYGFCDKNCRDDRVGFMYANLNILTDEECSTLFKYQINKNNDSDLFWNKDYEICTGKKHKFPLGAWQLIRRKKRKNEKKKDKKELEKAKSMGLAAGYKPTSFTYIKGKRIRELLGTPNGYPYDWFLGATDSCQGDSGGPLWRNIKDKTGKPRATQIGTVARGSGCGGFNSPAIFGSVKMSIDWIKETVEKEMKQEDFCSKK